MFKHVAPDLNDVKVVWMGQDPYPNPDLATGIAFGIPKEIPVDKRPPTLEVMFDELAIGYYENPFYDVENHTLINWVNQGVLMINASMTCGIGSPEGETTLFKEGTHSYMWRTLFMEDFMKYLAKAFNDIIFVFCGKKAQYYSSFFTNHPTHVTLEVPHPTSDFHTGRSGFRGSKIYARVNHALTLKSKDHIEW